MHRNYSIILTIKKILYVSLFFAWFVNTQADTNTPWVNVYHRTYQPAEQIINASKSTLLYTVENTRPFTQLLCSWNCRRPQKGYFSFYIQVRDANTKKWGSWHLMAEWGKDKQKTYVTKSDGLSSFHHVRLEVDAQKITDAYRVKVEAHDGASLGLVLGLSVSAVDYTLFIPEQSNSIADNLTSVVVQQVPTIAQFALDHVDKSRICSPVSCAMLAEYLTGTQPVIADFLSAIFDEGLSAYGSWHCNVAHLFDYCHGKYQFFATRGQSFSDIHASLQRSMPVIVSVRGYLPGALKPFPHGHLMVVIGWDQQTREVLCHDPAAESHDAVPKRYAINDFIEAWERSYRLMYKTYKKT